jgi:hypothetical protein
MIKFKRFKGFKHKTTDIDNVNVQDGGTPQATVGTTASISEGGDDQELEAHPKPRKGFMKKATNAPLPTDRRQIATIISGDGTIGLSEEYEYSTSLHDKLSAHYKYTPEHRDELMNHTSDSPDLNNHLWNKHEGRSPLLSKLSWYDRDKSVNKMDSALSSHKTPHAMTVYAGVNYDPTSRGETVHHPAYLSTSIHRDVSKGFAQHKRGSEHQAAGKHIMAIHVPEGHSGAYVGHISRVSNEREFILPRGLNLKHSYTDTTMGHSSILRRPQPIHTHHMTIVSPK